VNKPITGLIAAIAIAIFIGCGGDDKTAGQKKPRKEPSTIEELGELLFFDPLLSKDQTISCASCHKPELAFADNVPFSFGVDSTPGTRNTPSAMNVSSRESFFHDGRAASLEEQALGPIENPVEMNAPMSVVVQRLNDDPEYSRFFKKIFGTKATRENLAEAIAAFERTLETGNTPFDRFMQGDESAISEAAKRGQMIFNEKAKCFDCHFGPDFTGDEFRNIGLFNGKELNDSGRYVVTKSISDIGRFKVPGLRNVTVTAPYMHNGMFGTLRQVIEFYNDPKQFVKESVNIDTLLMKPLGLTEQEMQDLEEFLKTLTDDRFTAAKKK
jgi:cytochrome c peroxidase